MINDTSLDIDLGTMLLEKKLVTRENLKECQDILKIKGGYLSQHLIESGYIKDSDLTTCLTCQYGYCYLPLKSYAIDENALQSIPKRYAQDYCVIPIEKNDKLLTVVMADPLNKGILESLRLVTSCEIIVFISTRTDIKEHIEKYYGGPYPDFKLDKFNEDAILRDNLVSKEVSNGFYVGPNRRRYRRLYQEKELQFYSYPQVTRTKALNISMSGLLFGSNTFIPRGAQLAVSLDLGNHRQIAGVVEVARFTPRELVTAMPASRSESQYPYEIGAFFTFLSDENQVMLAEYLKKNLSIA
ncbi:MAG TPA: hypothetical protein PLU24_05260 [Candidatus Omnitrophota bacterium]|nr:hypothetical protein [Candidatus Omnitrophota bacterium]